MTVYRLLRAVTVLVLLLTAAGQVSEGGMTSAAASTAPSERAPGPGRAMWVWTRPDPEKLVRFATRHRVTELSLSVPPKLSRREGALAWVRAVRKEARPAGIRLQALGGDPGWCEDPGAAVAWQRAALGTGLFAGSHVDIEPWGHRRWDTERARLIAGYVAALDGLRAGSDLPLEADIAFWLHGHAAPDGTPLDEAVMRRVDGVTVMSYRKRVSGPDSITSLGSHALRTGAELGVPVRLAVETNRLGTSPVDRKQTFFGTSRARLSKALRALDELEATTPSYAGMAVHDFAGWKALPRRH